MLIIWKFPKSIVGHKKHPRGPHLARVFETPDPTQGNKTKQDHTSLFSKLVKLTNHSLLIFV